MQDYGATYTDKQIAKVEKELTAVYKQAYKDIAKKEKEYLKRYEKKNKTLQKKLRKGEIDIEDYKAWQKGQVFQGERWREKRDLITDILAKTNGRAVDIVNGRTPKIFAENANNMAYMLEHGAGVNFNFGLYSVDAVTNIIKNNPKLLPTKKLDPVKDKTWNRKKINRQVSLAIIEGEDIFKVADRIAKVTASQNYSSMLTMARTAMTGAQNAGRQLTLDNAKKKGIEVKKEWMATLDGHTRHTHRMLDGQKRDLDKPFEVDGMKIMYPGDPEAHPSLVYNCRCTMVGDIEDYPEEYERYDNINGKPVKNMTYQEWKQEKSGITAPQIIKPEQENKNPDNLPKAVLDIIGYKKDAIDIDVLMKTVNPKFNDETFKYSLYHCNCQRCVACYELGRRGYSVEALPFDGRYPGISTVFSLRGYRSDDTYLSKDNDKYKINRLPKTTAQSIINAMTDWGDGARATLSFEWRGSSTAHVVNIENVNGKITIFDPQCGLSYTDIEYYLSKTKCTGVEVLRTDTLRIADDINIDSLRILCKKRE